MLGFAHCGQLVVEARPVEELLLVVENVVLGMTHQPLRCCRLGGERGQHGGSEGGRSAAAIDSAHCNCSTERRDEGKVNNSVPGWPIE